MDYCKVQGCRYNNTHTTHDHLCGNCKNFGHGKIECNSTTKKLNLIKYHSDKLPENLYCDIIDCPNKEYHTRNAHHCSKCKKLHSESNCIIQTYDYWKEHFQNIVNVFNYDESDFKNNYFGKYITMNIGMGCCLFVRNNAGNLEALFMHSDNWGQYGPETDHRPIYYQFINDYDEIQFNLFYQDNNFISNEIKCPLCRTIEDRNNIMEIKGLSEKCKICMEKDIELFFPSCKHASCCKDCFNNL
jgi:hypothetical protein